MLRKKLSFVLLLVGFSSAWALEPPTKEQLEQYQRDGTLSLTMLKALALGNHVDLGGLRYLPGLGASFDF
jgi:hypothetical protein